MAEMDVHIWEAVVASGNAKALAALCAQCMSERGTWDMDAWPVHALVYAVRRAWAPWQFEAFARAVSRTRSTLETRWAVLYATDGMMPDQLLDSVQFLLCVIAQFICTKFVGGGSSDDGIRNLLPHIRALRALASHLDIGVVDSWLLDIADRCLFHFPFRCSRETADAAAEELAGMLGEVSTRCDAPFAANAAATILVHCVPVPGVPQDLAPIHDIDACTVVQRLLAYPPFAMLDWFHLLTDDGEAGQQHTRCLHALMPMTPASTAGIDRVRAGGWRRRADALASWVRLRLRAVGTQCPT